MFEWLRGDALFLKRLCFLFFKVIVFLVPEKRGGVFMHWVFDHALEMNLRTSNVNDVIPLGLILGITLRTSRTCQLI